MHVRSLALVALMAMLGCPAGDDTSSNTGGNTEGSDGTGNGMTSTPPATTAMPTSTSAGQTDDTTAATDPDPDGTTSPPTDDSTSGTAGDSTSTGGEQACAPDLPDPQACNGIAPPPPGSDLALFAEIPGQWHWRAPTGVVTDPDPQAGGGFIEPPDGGNDQFECDIFLQDCPVGEKCMPWAFDGGPAWNGTRCSPIDPAPDLIGETCTVEGSGVSGIDSCEAASMCWNVDDQGQGVCVEMCSCSIDNPICNTADTACAITNMGVIAVCLAACNPLDTTSCLEDEGCYPVGELFLCAPSAAGGGGQAGDPCQFINACETGLVCVGAGAVPGCDGTGCCSPVCEIGDDTPCLAGQACTSWYEPGQAPDACWGTVGVCTGA